jgi:hypothetical protein
LREDVGYQVAGEVQSEVSWFGESFGSLRVFG